MNDQVFHLKPSEEPRTMSHTARRSFSEGGLRPAVAFSEGGLRPAVALAKEGQLLKLSTVFLLCFALLALAGCEPDVSDDAIPWQPFDVIQINLNLPQYLSLKSDGGSMTIDGGVRGIILYRQNASTYIAYEANCSFQPNSACATVEVHVSSLYLFCACCSSNFDFATGYPTGGPAWRPLRRYATTLSGSVLTITDEVLE